MARIAFFENDIACYREGLIRELLNESEHEFYFLGETRSKQPFRTVLDRAAFGGRFVRVPSWELGRYAVQPRLLWITLSRTYDVFIVPPIVRFPIMWLAMAIARMRGKRVFLFGHCWIRKDPPWIQWVKKILYSVANGYLLFGNYGKKLGMELGIPSPKLVVVFNSVPHDSALVPDEEMVRHFLQDRFPDRPSLPVVAVVTRLLKVRRVDVLFHAAKILESQGQPVNLLILNDGPMRESLSCMASELDLSVSFEGVADESEVARAFTACHVSVCPGPIGLTAIHSVAYDTPAISFRGPENQNPESEIIIPGVTGDFFTRNDPQDLARVLKRWIGDRKLKCGETGRKLIENVYCPQNQVRVIDRAITMATNETTIKC